MNTYQAIKVDPLTNDKHSGVLTISFDRITFQSTLQTSFILLDNLSISVGGASNRILFLNDTKNEKTLIYTTDKSILNDDNFRNHPAIKAQIKSSKKSINTLKTSILWFSLVTILLCLGVYFSKDWMVKKIAQQIPTTWEGKAGEKLFEIIKQDYSIIENDSLKKIFLQQAKPLLDEVRKQGIKIDLYFVNDPTINAFALPGGVVVIQTGLIENANNWEEVMGVLAHELAHVTERHHLRGIVNNMGLFAIISASFGDVSAVVGTLASVGTDLASLSNSRHFEIEADEVGWEYLNAAKIRPNGMISFFKILEKEHEKKSSMNVSFLSTHPATNERIKKLSKKWDPKKMSYPLIENDYQKFKQSLIQKK